MKITFAILPYIELDTDIEIFGLRFERYNESSHKDIKAIVGIFYDSRGDRINNPTVVFLDTSKTSIKEFDTCLRKITAVLSYVFLIEDVRNNMYLRDNFIFEIFEKIKEKNSDMASRTQNGFMELFELSKRKEYCPWYIHPFKIKKDELVKHMGYINAMLSDESVSRAVEWYSKSRLFLCNNDNQMSLLFRCIAFETLFDLGHEKKTNGIINSIKLFVFEDQRLNSWIREFYNKRCDIVHEGKDIDISIKEEKAISYGSDFIITDFLIKISIRNKLRVSRLYDFDRIVTDHLGFELKKWLESNTKRFNKLLTLKISDLTRSTEKDDSNKSDEVRHLLLDMNSSDLSPGIALFEQTAVKLKLILISFIDHLLLKEMANINQDDQIKIKEIRDIFNKTENKIEKISTAAEQVYQRYVLRTEPLPPNFDLEKDMDKLFNVFNRIYKTTKVPLDEIVTTMEHISRLYSYKRCSK